VYKKIVKEVPKNKENKPEVIKKRNKIVKGQTFNNELPKSTMKTEKSFLDIIVSTT